MHSVMSEGSVLICFNTTIVPITIFNSIWVWNSIVELTRDNVIYRSHCSHRPCCYLYKLLCFLFVSERKCWKGVMLDFVFVF